MTGTGSAAAVPGVPHSMGHRRSLPWLWIGHALLAGTLGMLLFAFSTPGYSFPLAALAGLALLVSGGTWIVLLGIALTRRRPSGWLAVAPVLVVVTLALLAVGMPMKTRWAGSRADFDRVVAQFDASGQGADRDADGPDTGGLDRSHRWTAVDVPDRVGTYEIKAAYRVDGGFVFYAAASSNMFDDGGFAYLPGGPDPTLVTPDALSPVFHPLGGPWYAWTASW